MDAGSGEALMREVSGEEVCILLSLDEHQGHVLWVARGQDLLQLLSFLEL